MGYLPALNKLCRRDSQRSQYIKHVIKVHQSKIPQTISLLLKQKLKLTVTVTLTAT